MNFTRFLFSDWATIERIVIVGTPIYVALIIVLKLAGKHALAKSNAYGLVVTIALGSTFASAVLTRQVALTDGIVGIGLLLGLQYILSTLTVKYQWASRWVTANPALVVWQGRILHDALNRDRLTESDIYSAVRSHGFSSVDEVSAVVLETDGSLSVIHQLHGSQSALADVTGMPGVPGAGLN